MTARGVEQLEGTIEYCRARAKGSDWAVFHFRQSTGETCAIRGVFPAVQVGDKLTVVGCWVEHPTYGLQFDTRSFSLHFGDEGLFRFLCELEQIGPKRARVIVERFGDQVLDVIRDEPEKLLDIPGLTPARVSLIQATYQAAATKQETLLFLQSLELTSNQISVLLEECKNADLPALLKQNPYAFIGTARITFRLADEIGHRLGIEKTSPFRIQAGAQYAVQLVRHAGHTYAERDEFVQDVSRLLAIDGELVVPQLEQMDRESGVLLVANRVYVASLYYTELDVARDLKRLQGKSCQK